MQTKPLNNHVLAKVYRPPLNVKDMFKTDAFQMAEVVEGTKDFPLGTIIVYNQASMISEGGSLLLISCEQILAEVTDV